MICLVYRVALRISPLHVDFELLGIWLSICACVCARVCALEWRVGVVMNEWTQAAHGQTAASAAPLHQQLWSGLIQEAAAPLKGQM